MWFKFSELILLSLLIFLPTVLADMGPKPQLDIAVYDNNIPVSDSVFYAKLFYCLGSGSASGWDSTQGCDDRIPKEICPKLDLTTTYDRENGCLWISSSLFWGGLCKRGNCHFSYRTPDKFLAVIFLPSKNETFVSNIAENKNFNSDFRADLRSDGTLDLVETTSYWKSDASKNLRDFMLAFVITITLELIVALAYFNRAKNRKHLLTSIFAANLISLPLVWFLFPVFSPAIGLLGVVAASEAFAVLFETYFIYPLNKKYISVKTAFLFSIIANGLSFFIGGFIYLIFLTFF
jgi:hypothetical protein